MAAEFCLLRWKNQLAKHPDSFSSPLGSVISVDGPMLSYPTVKNLCPTPVFVFHRGSDMVVGFKKGFSHVRESKFAGDGMPRSKAEWEPIMRFWSENLSRRQASGLYEVMSGSAS